MALWILATIINNKSLSFQWFAFSKLFLHIIKKNQSSLFRFIYNSSWNLMYWRSSSHKYYFSINYCKVIISNFPLSISYLLDSVVGMFTSVAIFLLMYIFFFTIDIKIDWKFSIYSFSERKDMNGSKENQSQLQSFLLR